MVKITPGHLLDIAYNRALRAAISNGIITTARTPEGRVYDITPSTHPVDYRHLRAGSYEADEIEIMRVHMEPSERIVEIGANIGVVTCAAIEEKLLANGRYVCVEPNMLAIESLRRNISRHVREGLSRVFAIETRAIGTPAMAGDQAAFIQRPNLSSGLKAFTTAALPGDEVQVPVTTMGRLIQENFPERRGAHDVSAIIDGEGIEIALLEKDPSAFDRIGQMIIELHDPRITMRHDMPPEKILAGLKNLGFKEKARKGNTYCLRRPQASLS